MSNYAAMKFQRFLRWLGAKLFQQEAAAEPDFQQTGVRVRPPHARPGETRAAETLTPDTRPEMVKFRAELGGQISDGGPGKNVLVRSKFVREESGTHDNLKILDGALFEEEEEDGIDPYNTGRFDRAKSWEFRSRK
ncbi:MAG TPA: hypothetical protein VNQ14_09020 [Woeseiaceae bacterium]|nr:hypothetical protein [Woeseiaceae bacterium]